MDQFTRTIVRGAALPTAAIGVVISAVVWATMGSSAGIGALLGTVIVVVFFMIGQLVLGGVLKHNPQIKVIGSPYDNKEWVAMPALNLDVALLHVDRADARGVCQISGPDMYMDDLYARAAKQTFVSCDELVETSAFDSAENSRLVFWERSETTGVVHLQWGAHPTSCAPAYGFDTKHFKEYAASAKEETGWSDYVAKYVNCTEQEYLDKVGGAEAIKRLPLPVF